MTYRQRAGKGFPAHGRRTGDLITFLIGIAHIMHYLTRRIAFEASHHYHIPDISDAENYALFGPTANPNGHGHNYVVEVTVKGDIQPENGMVINIVEVNRLLEDRVVAYYDHKHINHQHPVFGNNPSLQPTSENLAIEIWKALEPHLKGARLHCVKLYENSTLSANYYGEDEMVYLTKVYEFSASHRLHSPYLSDAENEEIFGKCNNQHGHGHNYILEVTVTGAVDQRTGMIADLDFLDETVQKQVYARFDYKHLNHDTLEFETLNPTSENFVKVLWDLLEPSLSPVRLHRLRLRETPKNYFDYYGDEPTDESPSCRID
jgi:6-pyruvoyltetrahydropterin/6-carboxytetrahydropterin synthase